MNGSNRQEIDKIIERKNSREKKLRVRSILIITVLFISGVVWLVWTNNQVNRMNQQVLDLEETIDVKEQHIEQLKQELSTLNEHLHEADNFRRLKIDISPEDRKYYHFTNDIKPKLRSVFIDILEFQNQEIRFNLNGRNPIEGFNSPSFISYILKQEGVTEEVVVSSSRLISNFVQVSDGYKTGDLLVYRSGYCMMYFTSYTDTDFVIGMTPSGILALSKNFAEIIAHLRPEYN